MLNNAVGLQLQESILPKRQKKEEGKKGGWNILPRVVFKSCGPACFEC